MTKEEYDVFFRERQSECQKAFYEIYTYSLDEIKNLNKKIGELSNEIIGLKSNCHMLEDEIRLSTEQIDALIEENKNIKINLEDAEGGLLTMLKDMNKKNKISQDKKKKDKK